MKLVDIEQAAVAALKAGDRSRLDILRLLINTTKTIAKNDGNRSVQDDDIISAGNRMIKQARETLSFLQAGDDRIAALDMEITVVEEFLPNRMSSEELRNIIVSVKETSPEGKAARGHIMKHLNTEYRGRFDSREANEILGAIL